MRTSHRGAYWGVSAALAMCLGLALIAAAGPSAAGQAKEPPAKSVTNKIGMEFVLLPAGSFWMGSPESELGRQKNETLHRVTISRPFYMQATEVTLGQWRAVMGKRWLFPHRRDPETPKIKVSWYDVQDFLEKLNQMNDGRYRLPTEAEWEYAARAGSTTAYAWGNGIDCSHAMYGNNTHKDTDCLNYVEKRGIGPDHPAKVKSYPPNAWGLYDMAGNVWEWCQDWYTPKYPAGEVTDPTGPDDGRSRVRRGGSWFGGPTPLRSANRNFANPAFREATLGFRLVRETD